MNGWITSKDRKRWQRAINRAVRDLNRGIERDDLWRGRFVVRQTDAAWVSYPDSNDHFLSVALEYRDKKTGQTSYLYGNVNSLLFVYGEKLWRKMNDFIVDECDVWAKEGHEVLRTDTTDWTKVK